MNILITGSEGSLMQAVIPRLLAQGHTITGVDNLYRYGRVSTMAGVEYQFIQADLSDWSLVKDIAKGFDVVFLAAAKLYGVGGFNHYCADIIADDVAVQGNILKSCVNNQVSRVVYISSSMVYETSVQDVGQPVAEELTDDCKTPKTEYGLTKLVGERMCQAFKKQYNLDYTIWRPFNILTPHEHAMSTQGFGHVFADFIDALCVKKLNPLPIIGNGEQIRCFTWIDDVANIIAKYSIDERTKNSTFNICNVEPISMKQLAQMIYQHVGSTKPLEFVTVKDYPNDVQVRIPSVEKLKAVVGEYQFQCVDKSIEICINNL